MERESDGKKFKIICNECDGEGIRVINEAYYKHEGMPSYDYEQKKWIKSDCCSWSPMTLTGTDAIRDFIFEIRIEGGKVWYETWEETMR